LRELLLRLVESTKLPLDPVDDDIIAIRILDESVKVDKKETSLAGVLEREVRSGQRIDERGDPLLAVEDEVARLGFPKLSLGTAQELRCERRVSLLAAQQEQRTDVVTADDRSEEVCDLPAGPHEVALKARQADRSLVRLFNQSDDVALVREDFHVSLSLAVGITGHGQGRN
jgi:hypothetical protein